MARLARAAFAAPLALALFCSACHLLSSNQEPQDCADCPGHRPRAASRPTVMALARDLDELERHVERYGSIVPKAPDVWGQARLTKHREEFEQYMAVELGNFQVLMNGSLTRADSAFAAQAVALGASAGRAPRNGFLNPPPANITSIVPGPTTTTVVSSVAGTPPPAGTQGATAIVPVNEASTPLLGSSFTLKDPKGPVALEPTLVLEQKARYLNLLNQIRRTNEGDDTADSPGYSLNLVRIPVSVLPGKKTQTGYGAEITFTLTPVLSDALLPTTFRNLVINDLADQLAFPLVRFLEHHHAGVILSSDNRDAVARDPEAPTVPLMPGPIIGRRKRGGQQGPALQLREFTKSCFDIPSLAPFKGLQGRSPFPNSQIIDVYGMGNCFEIAFQANLAFKQFITTHKYAHLPDVQGFLLSELNSAHAYLALPTNRALWAEFCTPQLVLAVRNRDYKALVEMRCRFRERFRATSSPPPTALRGQELSITAALAWCILVDSALLNDRLIRDMKETALARGCPPFCGGWLDFFSPSPSAEARAAFEAYVRCRWPIRVFALDPANQEQNLIDESNTRRELQLALSLAFVSGRINANTLSRFSRRLEAQYETIALNRTQVGFSHGENVFGWRFTPRFQSPDTPSNATVLFRDLIIGGPSRNALLRQRRLEPGPRECVAIVLMPSFVPAVSCDSVASWFALPNPKHRELDLVQAMRASRAVKGLKLHAHNVTDAECYRDGELQRLLRRVEQLEARLPTQASVVPVPIINTLGGFEMFNNGTTDLAPELYGFYGAPGARLDAPTVLFLVGDHFSPLRTRVIVGNQECPTEMLSRQVVKVVVPAMGAPTRDGFLHAHLATPYGVSREIEVPIASPTLPPPKQFVLDNSNWPVYYRLRYGPAADKPTKFVFDAFGDPRPNATLIWQGATAERPASITVTLKITPTAGPAVSATLTVDANNGAFTFPTRALTDQIVAKYLPTMRGDKIPITGPITATLAVASTGTAPVSYPVVFIGGITGPSLAFTPGEEVWDRDLK